MSYKAGFVGVVGLPNAGKSTLVNSLVKEKVSIVSKKPQTTRRRVLGIVSDAKYQIVFSDAPGLIRADKGVNSFLELEARDVMETADVGVVVLHVDEEKKENLEKVLEFAAEFKIPKIFLINKTDLVEHESRIYKIEDMIKSKFADAKIFKLSGKDIQDETRAEFLSHLIELLPVSPEPLYDVDLFTPHTTREIAEEIIREKCFNLLFEEVPYGIAVKVMKYEELSANMHRIYADIWVSRESHRPMVVGKSGEMIKKIGIESRQEIEKLLGHRVHLELHVVVRDEWALNQKHMKELGYVTES